MSAPKDGDDRVVEVDFTAHRDPLALADDIQTRVNEIRRDLDKATVREETWRRWQETAYRRALKNLQRQLAEERAFNMPQESDMLDALRVIDRPASSAEIAERIYRKRPPHSAVVRIGLALSQLAEAGRVRRVLVKTHGEERNRWEVVDAC
jgi:hypothetical protein